MGAIGTIDTDAAIGTILSNFSSDYIIHVIDDSLKMKFRPYADELPNYVDILERQFAAIYNNSPDFTSQVLNCKLETQQEIIRIICNYYHLNFTGDFDNMDPMELYGIARTLYDIFISNFTNYMIDFFSMYIINNADSIYASLIGDETAKKPKEIGLYSPKNYTDEKFIIIHANINSVILNMAAYDIPLQTLLSYFCDPSTAKRIGELLEDTDDIFKNYYASYITSPQTSASLLTCIKLNLQSKTQEAYNF